MARPKSDNEINAMALRSFLHTQSSRGCFISGKEKNHITTALKGFDMAFGSPQQAHKSSTINRNDKCDCGSGKKYKRCCGA